MARLYLTFEERVIREVALSGGVVTIGRQPDNLLQIDNPAVSGYHARVSYEKDHYTLEDNDSFNGTYVNNQRVSSATLADGDKIVIGKHTIVFRAQAAEGVSASAKSFDRTVSMQSQMDQARLPQLDHTVILDTKRAKEMLARSAAAAAGSGVTKDSNGTSSSRSPAGAALRGRRMGKLTVLGGRTDRQNYLLTSKLSAIGKSKLATIRLKRWFAPSIAASIQQREDTYFIVTAAKKSKIQVNGKDIGERQEELKTGDVIELSGIKVKFEYEV
jgi:pSer/pThr/pTyr-binding forkhead associated (FHA) protein